MILEQTTPPTLEPIDWQLMVEHLRLNVPDAEANLVSFYLQAARQRYEKETGKQLMTATYKLYLDQLPTGTARAYVGYIPRAVSGTIYLPKPPLASVLEVSYFRLDNEEFILEEGTDYLVDTKSKPGRVRILTTLLLSNRIKPAISISYTAGVADASLIGADEKLAIMALASAMYEWRETLVERPLSEMPYGFQSVVRQNMTGVVTDWNEGIYTAPAGYQWGGCYGGW